MPSMGVIRTNAAAAMLGVSSNTLRSWERRFAYPTPRRTAGGHRQYALEEIEALRSALEETHNISSAVAIAQQRGEGPPSPSRLRSALGRYDEAQADRLLEESLSLRSLERTVEEVLLPTLEEMADSGPADQPPLPEYVFAARWATGWMSAARRVAPPASRPEGVLVFDASRPLDVDSLHAQALELVLRRGGWRTLTFTVDLDATRMGRALTALGPRAVVLTGQGASLDVLGRLVYAARKSAVEPVEIFDYRNALPHTGHSTVARLGSTPLDARDRLLAWCEDPSHLSPLPAPLREVNAS
jgi:MerR family transcriptional regulator, light-induced transcriptional regulator